MDNAKNVADLLLYNMAKSYTDKELTDLKKSGGVGYAEETVIFPSTELELVEEDGSYNFALPTIPFTLTGGQLYKVIWNNAEYSITAIDITDGGVTMTVLGGGNATFTIVYGVMDGEEQLFGYTIDSTATMSIVAEVVHPITPKFLGEVVLPVVEIADITAITDDENLAITSLGGRPFILKSSDETGSIGIVCSYISRQDGIQIYSGLAASSVFVLRCDDGVTWYKV